MTWTHYIHADPAVLGGKPVVRGRHKTPEVRERPRPGIPRQHTPPSAEQCRRVPPLPRGDIHREPTDRVPPARTNGAPPSACRPASHGAEWRAPPFFPDPDRGHSLAYAGGSFGSLLQEPKYQAPLDTSRPRWEAFEGRRR